MSLDQLAGFARVKRTIAIINKEAKRHNRSASSIVMEMLRLYKECSFGPNYYLLAGMASNKMSWQEKCAHISDKQYHQAMNVLNPIPYRKITQHKLAEKSFLKIANIPSSDFLGFLEPIKGFSADGTALTNKSELIQLLRLQLGKNICIKIPEGYGGKGFLAGLVIEENDEIHIKPINDDKALSIEEVIISYSDVIATEGLLIESYIEQASGYSVFNPSSVNTVRTWVLQTGDKIEVIGGYFRMGRSGSLTDNGDGGGIMCPVDPISGVLGLGLLTSNPFRDELEQHIDNNVQLNGVTLPDWQQIVSCSCETLRKLPYTKFAGLDVAMSENGPVIIEVNVTPDKDGAAYGFIPSNKLLQAAELVQK